MRWPYGKFGLVLATEEHSSRDIVRLAGRAEAAGLGFAFFSDHFHPWNRHQGCSSNLWPVLGAAALKTESLGLVSAVTCPIFRQHPTTLAQAASTVSRLSEGRFVLGLGTGEYLNEGVVGQGWPPHRERLARLEEFVSHTRALWSGAEVTIEGRYYTVERATLFDPEPVPLFFAASGPGTVASAAQHADGLIVLGARAELVSSFKSGPCVSQISVCWAEETDLAAETAYRYFPEVALPGTLFSELRTPAEFEVAARKVSREDVAASVVCGNDPRRFQQAVEECFQAGCQAVALHQIGPDQEGFLRFWSDELRPLLDG